MHAWGVARQEKYGDKSVKKIGEADEFGRKISSGSRIRTHELRESLPAIICGG